MVPLRFGWMRTEKYQPYENSFHSTIVWCGPYRAAVIIADPILARDVMMRWKDFPKPALNYRILGIFGKNIIVTEGEDWKRHRKIISSQFGDETHARVVVETVKGCNEINDMWIRDAKAKGLSEADAFEVNLSEDMTSLTLNVLCSTALGMKTELRFAERVQPGHKTSFKFAFQNNFNLLHFNAKLVLPDWVVDRLPIPGFEKTRLAQEETEKYLGEILDAARSSEAEGNNVLKLLVDATDSVDPPILSDRELRSNALIFLMAGHDTTAGTLAYALALLAYHKDVQDTVYKEAQSILGSSTELAYKDLSKFKYTMAVMNETLRTFSLANFIPKWTENSQQKLGPFILPETTTILIHLQGLHYNPHTFGPDADKFNPDRFMGEDGAKLLTMMAPFSEGPRSCIGKKFSQVEFVTVLSFLSLRYEFEPIPGVSMEEAFKVGLLSILVKPVKPIRVIFRPRVA
ncbi:hypothetical protein HDU76_013912 [Blyttiomyces sp. JEL0837]|nr:hypothetical protein HDU76_013912 [Blyttiomyces sp. JEL0837]